ncbi:hypothetical protein D3C75_1055510 [compost metagenome]
MRRGGVAQTVNRFNNRAQRGEEADGVIRSFDVVIDGAWQTDAREAHFSQTFCTHIGAVTADYHQCIQTAFLHVLDSHLTDVLFAEFRETCRAQEGAAAVNHVRHAVAVELYHTIFVQAKVTVIDTKNF